MFVLFAFSYILRVQAKNNTELESIKWRLDVWFVYRSFVWACAFMEFFSRGFWAGWQKYTADCICLLIMSYLIAWWMFMGFQAHRAARRLLEAGDMKWKGKQIMVIFKDDKSENGELKVNLKEE